MCRSTTAVLVCLSFGIPAVRADESPKHDIRSLYSTCKDPGPVSSAYCLGYISAVADVMGLLAPSRREGKGVVRDVRQRRRDLRGW